MKYRQIVWFEKSAPKEEEAYEKEIITKRTQRAKSDAKVFWLFDNRSKQQKKKKNMLPTQNYFRNRFWYIWFTLIFFISSEHFNAGKYFYRITNIWI